MSALVRRWLLLVCLVPMAGLAHEVRPAYLELRESQPDEYAVLWKTPMRGELRLALTPEFSGRSERMTPVATRESNGAALQTWRLKAVAPLRGQTLRVAGLEHTLTDALVRIQFADGTSWTKRLTPQQPAAVIPERQTSWAVAGEYLALGVEHILLGADHLLFVLALLLIVAGVKRLVATVTAFTLAHSLTLAAATLGWVRVPQAPVEAVIALSIVFVAAEILHARQGRAGVAARAPWLVAFAFGLLHGFGFAGALRETGLPEGQIPAALLFFNIGVELGQLLFIAAALGALALLRRIRLPRWGDAVLPYLIGCTAMFWVLQRIANF